MLTGQSDIDNFSTEVPSSQLTLVCVQVDKKTYVAYPGIQLLNSLLNYHFSSSLYMRKITVFEF